MIGKRLHDWTKADIDALISGQAPEDDGIEFKEDHNSKNGRRADPWLQGGSVGDKARNEVIEEVVAFANGHGGTVIVGVEETDSKPARAASIAPLPRCGELAERFKNFCRDMIEPRPAIVDVVPIVTEGDDWGVVAIYTPKPMSGPHRHTATKECYVRRGDSSERMTMREIQDLTLLLDRGVKAIERRFEERRAHLFEQRAGLLDSKAFTIQATLLPLSEIFADSVHAVPAFEPPMRSFVAESEIEQFRCEVKTPVGDWGSWRPDIRSRRIDGEHGRSLRREVHRDGLIEYRLEHSLREGDSTLPFEWLLSIFAKLYLLRVAFETQLALRESPMGLNLPLTFMEVN
ncbi:MAG: ATP-binding protein [Alphaproteobacteria bacterium]